MRVRDRNVAYKDRLMPRTLRPWLLPLFISLVFFGACADDPPPDEEDSGVADMAEDVQEDVADTADVAADVPPADTGGSDPIVCRRCRAPEECGDPGNMCLLLPSGESACGIDCSGGNEDRCPPGSFCAAVGDDAMQCVPENLYCENQCGDPPRECDDEGDFCDPLTGQCGPPLGLCEECALDLQCGDDNLCLTFPDVDGRRGCGQACSTDEPCPDSYVCAAVDEAGTVRQCVPEILTCIDRCSAAECDEGSVCNPLNGECEPPAEFCDPCITNAQCGDTLDLCVQLLDNDAYCLQDCSNGGQFLCPEGTVCIPIGAFEQCVPTELTCTNRCLEPEPVVCDEGQNCDPVDGTCHTPQVDLCGRPCENNYECGGQNDMCIRFAEEATGAFCARGCADDDPCPFGYRCLFLQDGLTQQCAPVGGDANCDLCASTDCPDGEACRPSDGTCLPEPTACTTQEECGPGEICDTFLENRCEPVGLPCTFGNGDCSFDTECSATSIGEMGVCLQDCFAVVDGCPDTAPACGRYHRAFSVCTDRGLGRPERCGRLMDWDENTGRPCPTSETDPGCFGETTLCLEDVITGLPGVCTDTCNPDEEDACPTGSACSLVTTNTGDDTVATAQHYCVPTTCECMMWPDLEVGETDVMQAALDQFEITRCDLGSFSLERAAAGDRIASDGYTLALAGEVRNDPLFAPNVVVDQLAALDTLDVASALYLAADNLGVGFTDASLSLGTPTLCQAVQNLYAAEDEDRPTCPDDLTSVTDQLPDDIEDDIALIIAALALATDRRDTAIDGIAEAFDTVGFLDELHEVNLGKADAFTDPAGIRAMAREFNLDVYLGTAGQVAEIIEGANLKADGEPDLTAVDIELDTPLGLIVIGGTGDDLRCVIAEGCDTGTVYADHVALLIDLGGNDEYRGNWAATNGDEAVAVVLDMGGDDLYTYDGADESVDAAGRDEDGASLSDVGRQGAGRAGYGMLFDWGQGEDTYLSLRASQGFGEFGVGVLYDDGCTAVDCTDQFTAEAAAQGAGFFGIGLLMVGAGSSDFDGVSWVQGVGGVSGAGLLIDQGGDDTYTADPGEVDDPMYPAPSGVRPVVGSAANWSVAQGAAAGIAAAVPSDGPNFSGGVGLLIDLDGDDEYAAGLLAQGAGYWHGLGIVIEGGGNDRYETNGFSQGAGIDFGAGVLVEQEGTDTYNGSGESPPSVLASGRNFGTGVVIEELGDDTYGAGPQSLGVGFFNGFGLFLENLGDDDYTAIVSGDTLGKATLSVLGSEPVPGGATNPRRGARTIGLFVDADGADQYPNRDIGGPDSDATWTQTTRVGVDDEPLFEWGMGADDFGSSGVSTLP